MKELSSLKELLDSKYLKYAQESFIKDDPISIPRGYSLLQDVEITAFWTAILSWGQRVTIIKKANDLFERMDGAPYDFIMNHKDTDLAKIEHFVHRTFNGADTLYFIHFLKHHYQYHSSLEEAFCIEGSTHLSMYDRLSHFQKYFFSLGVHLPRTQKHISTPTKNAACKRINMFLRWMVRTDAEGIDLGLWKRINPSELMIPYDVHVERTARKMGLVQRTQKDWKAVEELTNNLRKLDPDDPVKYDFALFGMSLLETS